MLLLRNTLEAPGDADPCYDGGIHHQQYLARHPLDHCGHGAEVACPTGTVL